MGTGAKNTAVANDWHGPCQAPTPPSPPARTQPRPARESWDLDAGDVQSWMRAQRVCLEQCPFLTACQERRDKLYPHPARNPAGVIWAGVAYSETGRVLDTEGLRRLSATQRGRASQSVPTEVHLSRSRSG